VFRAVLCNSEIEREYKLVKKLVASSDVCSDTIGSNEVGLIPRLSEVSGVAITSLQSGKKRFLPTTHRGRNKIF